MRSPAIDTRTAFAAVITLFAVNGLVFGVYAASIPILREEFALSVTRMAILFVVTGIAAIASMQVTGRLADAHGARLVCLAMIIPLIIAACGYALVGTYPFLLVTGVFLGIGNGGIDVAMNAVAVQVEKARLTTGKHPVMSFFHGMWAVGCFLGSLAVSLTGTAIGLAPRSTVTACCLAAAAVALAGLIVSWFITPQTAPVPRVTVSGEKKKIPWAAYLMGLMAIAFGLGEGTASDWSGAHVTTVADVDPRLAAWAVTSMMACMVIIRLIGDFLVTALGRRTVVYLGGAVAAAGYLTCTLATPFPALITGWALVGLGMGVIAPQVYASAGHMAGGRGLAVVVTFGYATFLVGPAFMGSVIHFLGIHHAMATPGVLLLGLIPLARITLPTKREGLSSTSSTSEPSGHLP